MLSGWVSLYMGPSATSIPTAGHHVEGGIPLDSMPLSILPISMWHFYCQWCRSYSVSPQFSFRRDCSICRCRFGVSVGGEFRAFLCHHPGGAPLTIVSWCRNSDQNQSLFPEAEETDAQRGEGLWFTESWWQLQIQNYWLQCSYQMENIKSQ